MNINPERHFVYDDAIVTAWLLAEAGVALKLVSKITPSCIHRNSTDTFRIKGPHTPELIQTNKHYELDYKHH